MASTYSNLKIQLMATGENSGTWGNVTNVNLGTALEEAIVGSEDVTFASANVTLTLTDTNASQTARNLRLNLTGTTGGARDLIVPAIEKLYIVNNGCADTVTIKVTGQTGIAVPAGKTLFVYNNGTDCVNAITHLTSLTLATALPVASGGTGSTTATFSGENITSLNASSISSGTIDNARTTASASNGASTIVARDASGDFASNVITHGAGSNSAPSLTFAGDTNTGIYSSGADAVNFAEGGAGYRVGFRNIPQSGSDKATSYTLALGDIGEFVGVGSGGSITIPDATFAAGDAVSIFNNTTGNITITCTITTAYIAGTNTDKASVALATRGVCTILFISSTVCVISGNVS
jgi:hypothetical protein